VGSPGIERRLRRIGGANGRFFLFALDHGVGAGPVPGIQRPVELVRSLHPAAFTGVIMNPGMVRFLAAELPRSVGLVVHLSASTVLGSSPTSKVLSSTVERAVALGADAVSVQISFGDPNEDQMIADAGRVIDGATSLGIPVLVMAYAPAIPGESSSSSLEGAHAARAAAEIGAALVQTNYAGDPQGLRGVVKSCPVPVVAAGGPPSSSEGAFLDDLRESMRAGAAGVSLGRRIFQATDPAAIARRIAAIVFEGNSPLVVEAVG
jgi:DhnA family fructose-bisphosphate aldolase class Ia